MSRMVVQENIREYMWSGKLIMIVGKFISYEEAEKILSNKDNIHTFRKYGAILMGVDWEKKDQLVT